MEICSKVMAANAPEGVADNSIEVSIRGRWVRVPALNVSGKHIVVRGRWVKIAAVHDEEWLETELDDPEQCIYELRQVGRRRAFADIFTFSQKLPATVAKHPYSMEWGSMAAIHLTSFKDWWEGLPQETRKNVRRSQRRGVAVRITRFDDDLIRGISEVNNDCPMRQRVRNVHYGKTLEEVKRDYSAFVDRSDFICAYVEDELIGFLKLVYRGGVASILNLTPKPSHADKRPANALIAKAVELCGAKRISYITYGMFNYGNKQDSPLREFKIRNGFKEILIPRFYVPLTSWGRLCMKMHWHRGLLGILPHRAIVVGISSRAVLYKVREWLVSRCSSTAEQPNCIR